MTYLLDAGLKKPLAITPHPKAPLFEDAERAQGFIRDLVGDASSPRPSFESREVVDYMRQFFMVSLWGYLKLCASFAGPYELVNDDLHLDMCNFRQSDECMDDGAKAAAFIARGFFKSTCLTHGADGWELLRNPNHRILIVNAVTGKADRFKSLVQRQFDHNELTAFLFPEYCPNSHLNAARKDLTWNEKIFAMPNRTRDYAEGSVTALGVESSAEGIHCTLFNPDDLVGLDDLDVNHNINVQMLRASNWMSTNLKTLLVGRLSRIFLCATRFGEDDTYASIASNCKAVRGYEHSEYKPTEDGEWVIYHRDVQENGRYIFEDVMDQKTYERMLKDDPWTAILQYSNRTKSSGLKEFQKYKTGNCRLELSSDDKRLWIVRVGDENYGEQTVRFPAASCTGIITVDMASTKKGITAKTSRTSIGVWFVDSEERYYRVWQRVGYYSVPEWIEMLLDGAYAFWPYVDGVLIEENAMQKGIIDMIEKASYERGIPISIIRRPAKGDKVVRIRMTLTKPLAEGRIFLAEGCAADFISEQVSFSSVSTKLDVLDESEKAISYLTAPLSPAEEITYAEDRIERALEVEDNAFGY